MRIRLGSRVIEIQLNPGIIKYSISDDGDAIWNKELRPNLDDLLKLVECVSKRRAKLLVAYNRWSQFVGNMKKLLKEAERMIAKHLRNSIRAEAIGSSLSTAGSTIAVTGLALSLPTAGLALGLVIGGSVASGLGTLIATGSSIVGGILRKRLKKAVEKDYDVFKTRSEKLQLRCNEYIQSLNEFVQLLFRTILPYCAKMVRIENPSLFRRHFQLEENSIVLSPVNIIEIMLNLSKNKRSRKDSVALLEKIRDLILEHPYLCTNHTEISSSGFCDFDRKEDQTSFSATVEKRLKDVKSAISLIKAGGMTPTLTAKAVDMSADMADAFAKGAAIAGRTLSITLSSVSLGIDVLLMGNSLRKLYKGSTSGNLEKVKELYKEVEEIESKVLEELLRIKITDSQPSVEKDKKVSVSHC